MIKVFNETKLIEIGDEAPVDNVKNGIFVEQRFELFIFLDEYFKTKKQPDVFIYGYNSKKLFKDFKSYFSFIRAAGGIVKNEKKQVLFIKRKGIWDLPKGKLNKNEKPKKGAVREVKEETGLKNIKVGQKLSPTYHIFERKGEYFLKKTDWYLMETSSNERLIPEKEEGITKVSWLEKEIALNALKSSYRSLKDSFVIYMNNGSEK